MNINVHQSRVDLSGCSSMASALAVSVPIKTNNKKLTYLKLIAIQCRLTAEGCGRVLVNYYCVAKLQNFLKS